MRTKAIAESRLAFPVLASLALSASARAAPLLNLTVEASITGAAGTYSPMLPYFPTPGATLYFEVVAQSAAPGTVNANTTRSPNGTSDWLVSLANFTLSSSGVFKTSSLQNNFDTASGSSAGTTGSNSLDIRAIELGYTESSDTPLVIDSGTMTVGSGFTGITASTDMPVNNAGILWVEGGPATQTEVTETSGDPLVSYVPLAAAAVPEPASLAIFGVAAAGLMIRRRTHRA